VDARLGIEEHDTTFRGMVARLPHTAHIDKIPMSCAHLKHTQRIRNYGRKVRVPSKAKRRIEVIELTANITIRRKVLPRTGRIGGGMYQRARAHSFNQRQLAEEGKLIIAQHRPVVTRRLLRIRR